MSIQISEILMSNFIQTRPVNERTLPGLRHCLKGTPDRSTSSEGKVSCTILNATTLARKRACLRLGNLPNLTAANFVSPWY